ncbi:MAG: type II toxin-antitoxin system YafQ family toxin [Deltaproteobacteria bacterium]|nr:type II toxin-antitoxin system YafQ family toxin [Deltaproteobacteria bacterium]
MVTPVFTRQFEKDLKRMKRQGKKIDKLKLIMHSLVAVEPIDPIHKDHRLIGNWQGRRECHIEADWLLIYKIDNNQVIFERTGSHSDLFR